MPDICHFFYTTSGCDGCDKYQVWIYAVYLHLQSHAGSWCSTTTVVWSLSKSFDLKSIEKDLKIFDAVSFWARL